MIVDLHIHTTISGDSIITPDILVPAAINAGLDGVCITEHGIEKSRIAEELAKEFDFPVFGGMEASTEFGDILIFGIDSYPRVIYKAAELVEFVKKAGGVLIAAHPFRNNFGRSTYKNSLSVDAACEHKILQMVDTMETFNGWSTEEESALCQEVSNTLGLNSTGGSDAHIPRQVGCCVTIFENRISDEAEFVKASKSGEFTAQDRRNPKQKGPTNWFS
ncbi:MAG: PHP-associated domain-containing protein [Thermodesulfobacteriota bacterium]|nr:PHP-associated domain-containing protein [Thermodesulfobacteriota bacterium]